MMLSTDPESISEDASIINSFLETNLDVLAHGGMLKKEGINSKDCKQWNTLKHNIKEASVQPLDLVKKNMEMTDIEDRGGNKTFVLKRFDWYKHVRALPIHECFYYTSNASASHQRWHTLF
jgi:hypothetical protein